MDNQQTVILGYDAVSPLGNELTCQWERAANGESGISRLTRFSVSEAFPVTIAGQVPDFDDSPYPFLRPRAMVHWKSPIFRYALLVVHRALQRSGIEINSQLAPRVAVTFSSAVGGLDMVLAADRRMVKDAKLPHPFTNPNSCINMAGGKVSILTGATGPILSTITACATGLTSVLVGAMLLQQGRADVAICGAVDFALVEPIVAGFATMNGAYVDKPDRKQASPEKASRPFAVNRRGFVISEGAGCIVIATREFARVHGLDYTVVIGGWQMTSDAYHFVAPRQETVTRCIAESVENAGIEATDIDAINAHAASTKIGDSVEHLALKSVFKNKIPPVSANKSMIGHAMGASSAIETIFAIEGMARGIVLPTINYQPDPELTLDCVPEGQRSLEQEFVLKNAFGFGGCNACVVLKRCA